MSINTYYITHIITITQEIPARSPEAAEKAYEKMMSNPKDFFAVASEGCTSTSTTEWEIEVRDAEEQDEYEEEQRDSE